MKNVRVVDQVYTLVVSVQGGQILNTSTPIYFTGYPVLRNKTIKSITFNRRTGAGNAGYIFLNLFNGKGDQLLTDYPASDLCNISNPALQTRQRLFNLYDIDLQKSYYIDTLNIPQPITRVYFELNFYF